MDSVLNLNKEKGLSNQEAANKLRRDGYNELPSQKSKSALVIFFKVLSEPMLILILVSISIYLFFGEAKDSIMLIVSIFFIVGITYYQERKTEKTLDALKNLSSPRASVIRDGEQIRIPGREVVKDDVVIIREGDRVPADATVIACENLSVDESLLTGESVPVRKASWDGKSQSIRPGGNDLPFVYSGSLVISGRGLVKVHAIGSNTEMGKIGKSLVDIQEEDTLLKRETSKIVKNIAIIGFILCGVLVFAYYVLRGNFISALLSGLTLAMAILPEEFPLVLVIFLTLGAWRISRKNVLTRNSAAIETLGAASVLCVDKTGTLTYNKTVLSEMYTDGLFINLQEDTKKHFSENFHKLLEFAILASQKDPYDPIEKELNAKGGKLLKHTKHIHESWELIKEYPLSKELLALSHVWKSPNKNDFVIASKGAPEAILKLCQADSAETDKVLIRVKEMSDRGLRVLGVAKAIFTKSKLPEKQHNFEFEFVGLIGFVDPIREGVSIALKEAYAAGIRVILITGDYPGTARFVAEKIGIKDFENIIVGSELTKMNKAELTEKIKTVNVFARIVPEQKLAIIDALKANKEVVAMTGDGVNDAPALKAASMGIAMGERGTDVARESADLVLLDDDFSSIVTAVRLGRRIYDNLKKAMSYLVAIHIPIAGMSLLPVLTKLPIVLFPAHITFMEFIIDPTSSMVFESEKEDSDIMNLPPRNIQASLFSKRSVLISFLQGFGVLIINYALYFYIISTGRNEMESRSFAFATLVLSNLLLILVNLSWNQNIFWVIRNANKILIAVLCVALISLFAVIYIPILSDLFHLAPLKFSDLLLIFSVVSIGLVWFEILKIFRKKDVLTNK